MTGRWHRVGVQSTGAQRRRGRHWPVGPRCHCYPCRGLLRKSQPLLPHLAQSEPFTRPRWEGGECLPLFLSSSRSRTLPLGLEVLVPGWERAKAAGYLGVSAGGWSRESKLEEPWHVALSTYPPGPATASRQPTIQPSWRCGRPEWVGLGYLGLAGYSLSWLPAWGPRPESIASRLAFWGSDSISSLSWTVISGMSHHPSEPPFPPLQSSVKTPAS